MAIYRPLQNSPLGPEEIGRLVAAYEQTLNALGLKDRNDPITQLVARKIIEIAQTGVRDPPSLRAWRSRSWAPSRIDGPALHVGQFDSLKVLFLCVENLHLKRGEVPFQGCGAATCRVVTLELALHLAVDHQRIAAGRRFRCRARGAARGRRRRGLLLPSSDHGFSWHVRSSCGGAGNRGSLPLARRSPRDACCLP